MKKNLKIIFYSLFVLVGLGSTIGSIIVEINFLDSVVVWQSLLGVGWTIASLFVIIFGLIGIFNTMHEKERLWKKNFYLNAHGKRKSFRNKEKYFKLDEVKQFLLTSRTPEKIYILAENKIYCTFEVYMESINPDSRVGEYDFNTRLFFIDETSYQDIDDAIAYLKNKQFIRKDDNVCVIGYEYSSPYYLQKRMREKE